MGKFSNAVDSLGSKTLASIARAGPDTKVSHTTIVMVVSARVDALATCGFEP